MTIKAVVFDMDGTIIHYPIGSYGSSWHAMENELGIYKKTIKLLEMYINKQDSYEKWFEEEIALMKGMPVSLVKEGILPPKYVNKVSFAYTCGKLKEMGMKRGILSSGVDLVANYIVNHFGLDFCYVNKVLIENGYFTGKGELIVNLWKKEGALNKLCEDLDVTPKEVAIIGDTISEVPLFKIAGVSFAINPKDDYVKKAADYVISDFTEIIPILENHP